MTDTLSAWYMTLCRALCRDSQVAISWGDVGSCTQSSTAGHRHQCCSGEWDAAKRSSLGLCLGQGLQTQHCTDQSLSPTATTLRWMPWSRLPLNSYSWVNLLVNRIKQRKKVSTTEELRKVMFQICLDTKKNEKSSDMKSATERQRERRERNSTKGP